MSATVICRACINCQKAHIKCIVLDGNKSCERCCATGVKCTFRPSIQGHRMDLKPKEETENHGVHRGADLLRGSFTSKIVPQGQHGDEMMVKLSTYSAGIRSVFKIGNTNKLREIKVTSRYALPLDGQATFIQSTCIINLNQACNGVVAALKRKGIKSEWQLIVISGLFMNRIDGDNVLEYYRWKGDLESIGVPTFCRCHNWDSFRQHFEWCRHSTKDISRFVFLNQIRGVPPFNLTIMEQTRNEIDGGIQCSPLGPDKWPIPKPTFKIGQSFYLHHIKLTQDDTGHYNLLSPNNKWSCCKKRLKMNTIPNTEDEDVLKFNKEPKLIPVYDQIGLIVVVSDLNGNNLLPTAAKLIPPCTQNKFNYGSIVSHHDRDSPIQTFFNLNENDNDLLCTKYKHGLELGPNPHQDIDDTLRRYSQDKLNLVSLFKIKPTAQDLLGGKFDGFSRIFAGDGSPRIDETFTSVSLIDQDLQVSYKFAGARCYSECVPLSLGMFDSSFHGVKIQNSHILKILKVVRRTGTFGSRDSVSVRGSNSYLLRRKTNSQFQPSPTEGPPARNSEGPQICDYIYYRQYINPLNWVFVLSFVNFLLQTTSMLPYYFLKHLAVLFSFNNDESSYIRFCSSGILTIDFYCSCHVDHHDVQMWCLKDMVTRLNKIISRFNILKEQGIPINPLRLLEARTSLKHMLWWGVSIPTTCCYQYITACNQIEVYQWFLCPGLGTTHFISNYWVHLMLAGLFSHCTSAPIYIFDGRAYFGRCPNITMFAWGSS